ncbi:MAG: aminoacyl-histidine dipeptidase [Bacteroidales bacterium]|nr:aminoacyl-histidine dipeptidase [Bacteroidales bacterium]
MTEISSLQPKNVWKFFDKILEIPRPSKKEEKIIAYIEEFARKCKLDLKKDKTGNIVISKEAYPGFENRKKIILQGHVDMVCEKNADINHDFNKDPIQAYIDNDWIRSKGTTLGADNGIGIAAQLAVLSDKSIKHGPLECLFTIDEETGLTGASCLEQNFITGDILINLDSEEEGEIYMGCAGGVDTIASISCKLRDPNKNSIGYSIGIKGLKGGHSGGDIEKGLGNSNKLLIRLLWNLSQKYDIGIGSFNGGNLRNAIPREAVSTIAIRENEVESILDDINEYRKIIFNEFGNREPNLSVITEKTDLPGKVMKKKQQKKFLNMLYAMPNGVIEMSHDIPGLVETSTNLASIKFNEDDKIEIVTSQRSSIESSKTDIANRIKSQLLFLKASVKHTESYPGWKPNTDSEILNITKSCYKDLFGRAAKIKAIHAGLECGLFLEKYPHLDMVSIGPTIEGAHSPDERMKINTVDKFWRLLTEVLKSVPEK